MDRRRALIAAQPRLPYGYREVEWIDNQGVAWIDTGILPTAEIEMYAKYIQNDATSNYILVSRVNPVSAIYGFTGSMTGLTIICQYGNVGRGSFARVKGSIYEQYMRVSGGTANYSIADLTAGLTESGSFASDQNFDNVSFKLGCAALDQIIASTKFCRSWIKKNGVYTMYYVPAVRESDGVAGMYDMPTKTFRPSSNPSGAFVAGPYV